MEEKYYFVKALCSMIRLSYPDNPIERRGCTMVKEEDINNISVIEANFKRLAKKEGLKLLKVEIEEKIECSEEETRSFKK